jgi:DNA-binding response OmpR family regulator
MLEGSVLIADDEETFRESTCRLLRHEGYDCRCVKDAEEAIEGLHHEYFDVLVSDIRMPYNPDFRVVKTAREIDRDLPIILVTGYPSMDTAIRGIDMAVDAYLTKPLNYDELLQHIHGAVKRSHGRRRLASVIERLGSVIADLESAKTGPLSRNPESNACALTTIRTLASSLSDLLVLWEKTAADHGLHNLCELLDCPQQAQHRIAIQDAVAVLEKTKDNFKSKQLAELRMRLERCLKH